MYRLLVKNLKQIVQIVDDDVTEFLIGDQMNNIKILNDSSNSLVILVDTNGKFSYIGNLNGAENKLKGEGVEMENLKIIDSNGGIAIPGFVDGHSHPVFSGDRVHEFAMKLAGATYMEVQQAGGGIMFTTNKTREASEQDLRKDFEELAKKMLRSGTTTLEAKSGYGLNVDAEMKMLRVLATENPNIPLEVSATFCGAHAVPKGSTEYEQTRMICEELIPKIEDEKRNGGLKNVENIDVFCEKGVFEVESSQKILKRGQEAGMAVNFHAEELKYIGGVEMGAKIGARAMSHLEEISDKGIRGMAQAGSVAVLLPSTAFILRLTPPPARKLIENNVIVALGSDFNPNAYCLAMPMIMHFACVTMKLSMPEALTAATLNSAHSIGRGKSHGAIAKGRNADFVILSANSWEHIIYRIAAHHDVINYVIKNGNVVDI
ncbi:putative imidazolonepropionase [Caenorhabditis elegans]|uniref:Probable imidazolonepropionase amdh-1 n=1 Tax=Caenorhabditis elegans TaxID=6239 RepID=HUTI_CAEEL|nr:putative imidazolonepropionase [Caenorhabditis elegans]CCD65224.1 Probable imidazolonepropionase [Caenorhabditis elegans]|eukprot:NP_498363.2 Uncharacterized protein CELE_T12A2.1 [Caenorhabditis elegans]